MNPEQIELALSQMRKNIVPGLSVSCVAEAYDDLKLQRDELLEACKSFEGYYDGTPDSSTRGMAHCYAIVREAIAKCDASNLNSQQPTTVKP